MGLQGEPTAALAGGIDFAERFAGFAPVPIRPVRSAAQLVITGTGAYWRFDGPLTEQVVDHSGKGNHLTLVQLGGDAPTTSTEFHPDQPGHASWLVAGSKNRCAGVISGRRTKRRSTR